MNKSIRWHLFGDHVDWCSWYRDVPCVQILYINHKAKSQRDILCVMNQYFLGCGSHMDTISTVCLLCVNCSHMSLVSAIHISYYKLFYSCPWLITNRVKGCINYFSDWCIWWDWLQAQTSCLMLTFTHVLIYILRLTNMAGNHTHLILGTAETSMGRSVYYMNP